MSLQTNISTLVTQGSRSSSPDLDWSQVRETVKLLNLAIAQLGGSLMHGDDSVNELTDSFTSMADTIKDIRETIKQVEKEKDKLVLDSIDQKCDQLSDKVSGAIVAFQFYDRFSQNLTHVNQCLTSLGEIVSDQDRLFRPSEWTSLQNEIRSRYTMSEEREMFDMVLEGVNIDEILSKFKNSHNEDIGEIELF